MLSLPELGWVLKSPSLSVGFFIQDEAADVTRSATHYHVDIIHYLPYWELKKGAWGLWYSGLGLHQLGSRPTFFTFL